MEAARGRDHIETFVSVRLDLSLLPARCAPGTFQSSQIDPDASTLPGTFLPEPGALHWRWPSVSIRSSSCHPVVTSTTPYRHRPSVRRVRPCLLPPAHSAASPQSGYMRFENPSRVSEALTVPDITRIQAEPCRTVS